MTKGMEDIIKNGHDEKFRYMMLGRMQADCNYFLGFGNRSEKRLWSGNVRDHIEDMKALYNSFPDNKKPEWLTLNQILEFENLMKVNKCENETLCCE